MNKLNCYEIISYDQFTEIIKKKDKRKIFIIYIKNYLIKYLLEDVKNFEPILALDGGLNGCKVIEKVIRKSAELLKRNGNLILEIDPRQVYETQKIMKNNSFHKLLIIRFY